MSYDSCKFVHFQYFLRIVCIILYSFLFIKSLQLLILNNFISFIVCYTLFMYYLIAHFSSFEHLHFSKTSDLLTLS